MRPGTRCRQFAPVERTKLVGPNAWCQLAHTGNRQFKLAVPDCGLRQCLRLLHNSHAGYGLLPCLATSSCEKRGVMYFGQFQSNPSICITIPRSTRCAIVRILQLEEQIRIAFLGNDLCPAENLQSRLVPGSP